MKLIQQSVKQYNDQQVSGVVDEPHDAVRHAHSVLNNGGHTQCHKLATVVGQTKLAALATTDMPWQESRKIV